MKQAVFYENTTFEKLPIEMEFESDRYKCLLKSFELLLKCILVYNVFKNKEYDINSVTYFLYKLK
jgi:hypothetical protein